MRTAILLSSILIAKSIGTPDLTDSSKYFFVVVIVISMLMDLCEFAKKMSK